MTQQDAPLASVRDATEDDLPRLIELLGYLSMREQREDPSQLDRYRAAFAAIAADANQRLLVLDLDGRIIGSTVLIIVPNLSNQARPWAQVENVVVHPDLRGRGYGEQLMRHALDAARAAGCYKLVLTSNKERADAHRFYRRLGFQTTHEAFRYDLS